MVEEHPLEAQARVAGGVGVDREAAGRGGADHGVPHGHEPRGVAPGGEVEAWKGGPFKFRKTGLDGRGVRQLR